MSNAGLRVGAVACCLNTPHVRGMGRYVQELLRESRAGGQLTWRLYADDPRHPLQRPAGVAASDDVFTFRGDRFHLWEQVGLPQHARRDRIDVLHCTEGSLPFWQPVPTIVTVHDTLAWQEQSGSGIEHHYYESLLPRALARCAAIVTISEASRLDILAKWPRLEAKVTVIPHGIADDYIQNGPADATTPLQAIIGGDKYIVYMGGPLQRKRFDWAIKVLADCPNKRLRLVACGFRAETHPAILEALPPDLRQRVHLAPFLEDAALIALYRRATAVLYPTLYEGFGFPAVEAQAAGVPAIFSAVSSLAELVGPLSYTASPHDLTAWREALLHTLSLSPQERNGRAAEARQWAKQFSWKRSFDAHLEVYARAAAAGRLESAR